MELTKLYKNCEELPLKVFLKIISTGNLRYLLREFREGEEFKIEFDFLTIWDNIFDEFQKLSGNTEIMRVEDIKNQILFLESLKMEIESCILYLNTQLKIKQNPDEEILQTLKNKAGVKSIEDLDRAAKKAASYSNRIKSLSAQLESEDKGKILTFDEVMAELYDYGYQVSDDISLSRFLAIKKRIDGSRKKSNSERRGDKSSVRTR